MTPYQMAASKRQIDDALAALDHIDDAEFGDCGAVIAGKRPNRAPTVPTCISCAAG